MLSVRERQAVANGLRMAAGSRGFDHCSVGGVHILRRGRISLQPEEPSDAAEDESTGKIKGGLGEQTGRHEKQSIRADSLLCHVSIDQQWSQWAVSGSLADLINRRGQEFTVVRAGIVRLWQLPQNGK